MSTERFSTDEEEDDRIQQMEHIAANVLELEQYPKRRRLRVNFENLPKKYRVEIL